jgi:hypothetical protein
MFKLEDLADIYTGLPSRDSQEGEARFLRLSDVTELAQGKAPTLARGDISEVARALPIQPCDVVIGARGAATDVCGADERIVGAYISLELYLVRPDTLKIHPSYLKAVLQLPATQAALAAYKQGTGLTRIPKDALAQLEIPLPPLATQRKIADLADLIEHEERLLARLADRRTAYHREILTRAVQSATHAHS